MEENEIISDIKDILIELSDLGNKVNVESYSGVNFTKGWSSNNQIKINIIFKKIIKVNDELYNDLLSLKLYLNRKGYEDLLFKYADSSYTYHKFYIYDDSRMLRNDDIHKMERWLPVSRMELIFLKKIENKNESKIKRFDSFLESKNEKYSIYEFFYDLHSQNRNKFSLAKLKENCDHFVGNGYFEKISNKVDEIIEACNKVNLNDVELRLYDDVYDNISLSIKKDLSFGILSGSYEEYDYRSDRKYSSIHFFKNIKENRKYIISDIIRDVIYPTLFINGKIIRCTDDSDYVTNPKWNCDNFNIKNYRNEFMNYHGIEIGNIEIKNKSKYTIDKVINMFKPAIICRLEGEYGKEHTLINIDTIESYIDEALECILPTISYEEVIFDYSRYNRHFENRKMYEYIFKIILK